MRIVSNRLTSQATAALVLSGALLPLSVNAQCPAGLGPPALAQAIVGLVTDRALNPLAEAQVSMRAPRRAETTTDQGGRFQFTGLPKGEYEIFVRKIGFEFQRATATVGDSGAVVRICLAVVARPLPAVVTSATRTGLFGLVADARRQPVPGAQVRILGNGMVTSTDSTGAFFLGAKAGHYAVTVSKEGYGTQMMGVTIPADSGREIAVWLGTPPLNKNRYAAELDEMHWRSVTLPASRYAIRTSEDLSRTQLNLEQVAMTAGAVGKLCAGGIDVIGQSYGVPPDMLQKVEVALLEVETIWPGKPGHRTGPPCAKARVWLKP